METMEISMLFVTAVSVCLGLLPWAARFYHSWKRALLGTRQTLENPEK
jgi:hypothetical protein